MKPCPLCRATDAAPLFVKDGVLYERCAGCGLATRGGAESAPSYHDYFPALTHTLPPLTRRRYEDLLGRLAAYRRTGRYLDVGCGGGHLVETARDLGWNAEGTEVSRAAAEFGHAKGLTIHVGVLADAGLPAESFDVITLMEVIEHVPAPVELLRECALLLRPGGVLYLTTPNWASLSRRLLGARWTPVCADHVVYFTSRHMRRALADAGFAPPRIVTANIQPHEIRAAFRRKASGPQPTSMERTMELRDTVEGSATLRCAKSVVNAILGATGTGDTIRALAQRR